MDIVFAFHSTWSMSEEDFYMMKDFMSNIVSRLDFGQTRVALLDYSQSPINMIWDLQWPQDKNDIINMIRNLMFMPGDTYTGEALSAINAMFIE